MPTPAYKFVVVSSFGRNARRPIRTASVRLSLLFSISLASGYVLSRNLSNLGSLPLRPTSLGLLTALGLQAAIACSLLLSPGFSTSEMPLAKVLSTLPISNCQCYTALLLPKLLLTSLLCCLAVPAAISVLLQNGCTWLEALAYCLAGVLGGYGIAEGLPIRRSIPRLVAALGLFWAEYTAWHDTLLAGSIARSAAYITMLLLPVMCLGNIPRNLRLDLRTTLVARKIQTAKLPVRLWLIKKLFRTRAYQMSLVAALLIALLVASIDRYQLILLLGTPLAILLAGLCAADIRGTARLAMPPEIANVKGTGYFLRQSILCALACACLVLSPLLLRLSLYEITQLPLLLTDIFMGACIGIAVGTLVVPTADNTSSQFLTLLGCLGCTVSSARLPAILSLNPNSIALTHLGISFLLLLIACRIEYKRNIYIGGKTMFKQPTLQREICNKVALSCAIGVCIWFILLLVASHSLVLQHGTAQSHVSFGPLDLNTISRRQQADSYQTTLSFNGGLLWFTVLWVSLGVCFAYFNWRFRKRN